MKLEGGRSLRGAPCARSGRAFYFTHRRGSGPGLRADASVPGEQAWNGRAALHDTANSKD